MHGKFSQNAILTTREQTVYKESLVDDALIPSNMSSIFCF